MKKILLSVIAASFAFAAFAAPTVTPTEGKATVVFSVPEVDCDYTTMNFIGDVQGYNPDAEDLPVAELVEDGWYKLVLPLTEGGSTQGKICPQNLAGKSVWDYQGTYSLPEGAPEWITLADDYGTNNKLVLSEGCANQVAYVDVTAWAADFCVMPNPAGEAAFKVSFEIPESVDPSDIVVYVEGQGEGQSWGSLGELYYDEDFEIFSAKCDVPAGCFYKYLISYDGGKKIYMKGDNIQMPYELSTDDYVEEWDENPFAPSVIFSIEPNQIANPNETVTFDAQARFMGEDVTYTYTIEAAQLTVDEDNTWTPATDGYTDGVYTVVVTAQDLDGNFAEASASIIIGELAPITVKLQASSLPEGWGDVVNLHTWGDASTDWPGNPVELDGEWYSYAFEEGVANVSIIWNNGNGMQTEDITSVTESTCYAIGEDLGDGKFAAQVVDCPSTAAEGTTADAVMSQKVIIGSTRYIIAGETIYEGLY